MRTDPSADIVIVKRAIEAAGSASALARELGLSRWAVHQWTRVPAERVNRVAEVTGIPREQLRPDLYERTPTTEAANAP